MKTMWKRKEKERKKTNQGRGVNWVNLDSNTTTCCVDRFTEAVTDQVRVRLGPPTRTAVLVELIPIPDSTAMPALHCAGVLHFSRIATGRIGAAGTRSPPNHLQKMPRRLFVRGEIDIASVGSYSDSQTFSCFYHYH